MIAEKHWSDGLRVSPGDLVQTDDGYYAVVRAVLPDGKLSLFVGNGLHEVRPGPVRLIPFADGCTSPCNFAEVMKPVEPWETSDDSSS